MSGEPGGRPGQPGQPHRFYFDDLADDPLQPGPAGVEPADDLVDTGPIEVIRDPVLGSAAGQQFYVDDVAPDQQDPARRRDEDAGQGHEAAGGEEPARGALAVLSAAHRPRPIGAVVAVLAVLVLVGVIAAVSATGHGGQHGKQQAAASATSTPTPRPTASTATRPGPSPASTAPDQRSSSPKAPHPSSAAVVPAGIPLTVLNNTTFHGLAAAAAQQFSTRGWHIGTVGNYAGQIDSTTVYYDPGDVTQRAAAETLASQFPRVTQVAPRLAGLPGTGLTVVLAPNWHS